MWCSAADTHLKLLDRTVSGARFLTGGLFERDIAHRRPVAVLCMLYKIRCNPMARLMMRYLDRICQCMLHAVPWSHIGILTVGATPLQNRAYRGTFVPLSVSLGNGLADPVFDGVGLAGFKRRDNAFLLAEAALSIL